jgi:hypothetical protein
MLMKSCNQPNIDRKDSSCSTTGFTFSFQGNDFRVSASARPLQVSSLDWLFNPV